jgi:hypothetical protein
MKCYAMLWFVLFLECNFCITISLASRDVRYFMHPRIFPFIAASVGTFSFRRRSGMLLSPLCVFRSEQRCLRFVLFARSFLLGMAMALRKEVYEKLLRGRGLPIAALREELPPFSPLRKRGRRLDSSSGGKMD